MKNKKKIFLSETICLDVWYVASSGGPLPSLFKLCPVDQKWPAVGVTCFTLAYMKKIFLSETLRPRVLIFGMLHFLVDLYQVCSNYAPGAKNGPALGSHVLHRLI